MPTELVIYVPQLQENIQHRIKGSCKLLSMNSQWQMSVLMVGYLMEVYLVTQHLDRCFALSQNLFKPYNQAGLNNPNLYSSIGLVE